MPSAAPKPLHDCYSPRLHECVHDLPRRRWLNFRSPVDGDRSGGDTPTSFAAKLRALRLIVLDESSLGGGRKMPVRPRSASAKPHPTYESPCHAADRALRRQKVLRWHENTALVSSQPTFALRGPRSATVAWLRSALLRRGWVDVSTSSGGQLPAPSLTWSVLDDISYEGLKSGQCVNHFERNGVITTKSGLTETLRQLPWVASVDGDIFFPRSYDLGSNSGRLDFVDDFRNTAAQNVVALYATRPRSSLDEPPSAATNVGIACLAIAACHERLGAALGRTTGVGRSHRGECWWDRVVRQSQRFCGAGATGNSASCGLNDSQWQLVLQHSYELVARYGPSRALHEEPSFAANGRFTNITAHARSPPFLLNLS